MNIVVAMAGEGSRFVESGHVYPKPLIRTGNTNRLSNFLLWQAAYSEIFFVKKMWPDFSIQDYYKVLNKFKNLKRNFGAV